MEEDTGRVNDRSMTDQSSEAPEQTKRRRVSVNEAAEVLGITAEAVRTRIKRGRLDSVKEPDRPGGTVYVLLEDDQTGPNNDPTLKGQGQASDQTELVEELRDRVHFLEQQVEAERESRRRADTIIAQLGQANAEQARTIRELEAPAIEQEQGQEAPQASRSAEETSGRGDASEEPQSASQPPQQSWWKRLFGG